MLGAGDLGVEDAFVHWILSCFLFRSLVSSMLLYVCCVDCAYERDVDKERDGEW